MIIIIDVPTYLGGVGGGAAAGGGTGPKTSPRGRWGGCIRTCCSRSVPPGARL